MRMDSRGLRRERFGITAREVKYQTQTVAASGRGRRRRMTQMPQRNMS